MKEKENWSKLIKINKIHALTITPFVHTCETQYTLMYLSSQHHSEYLSRPHETAHTLLESHPQVILLPNSHE